MEKKYRKNSEEILEKNSNAIEIDEPTDSEGKDFNFFSLYWKKK